MTIYIEKEIPYSAKNPLFKEKRLPDNTYVNSLQPVRMNIYMLFALLDMFMKEMAETTAVVCNHQDTDQRFAKYSNNLSYNPRHIKLGHPVQDPYRDKTLCFFPPSVECFASMMPTGKNQHALRRQKISVLSQLM